MGYFADELGVVYNRQGDFIRKTKEAIQAKNEQIKSTERSREALSDAFDAIGDGAGRLSSLLGQIDGLPDNLEKFKQMAISAFGALDTVSQTFSSIQSLQV